MVDRRSEKIAADDRAREGLELVCTSSEHGPHAGHALDATTCKAVIGHTSNPSNPSAAADPIFCGAPVVWKKQERKKL